ncbi:MAG: hypothetical protein EBY16_08350, partial [Gammaproteobacteria bacterium]|nr:hypothetical protein [Gammaproteobacteria bacterium]
TVYDGLYFISGVQYSFNDNQIIHHWDGVLGNLQGVHFPSFNFQDLSEMNLNSSVIPHNRLVFCPHIFGPLISDYFTITGPIDWEKNFGYISTKDWKWKDVPIIFTAMGGWLEGPTLAFYTEFQKWCNSLYPNAYQDFCIDEYAMVDKFNPYTRALATLMLLDSNILQFKKPIRADQGFYERCCEKYHGMFEKMIDKLVLSQKVV